MSQILRSNLFIYLVSTFFSICILIIMYKFSTLSVNIFELYPYYNLTPNPYYQFSLGLLTFIVISIVVLVLFSNKFYIFAWFIKAFVTIFVAMVLEYLYYGLDQFSYYVTAIYSPATHSFFQSSLGVVISINAFFVHFFGDSMYSLKIVNSFIAFCALVLFHKSYLLVTKEFKKDRIENILSYIIFFVPTILLWTSLLGKDVLILLPIALFTYSYLRLLNKRTLLFIVVFISSFILAFFIRPWIPLIMLMGIIMHNIKLDKKFLIVFIISLPLLWFIMMKLMGIMHVESLDKLMIYVGQVQQSFSRGNSAIELPVIKTLWDYVYYFLPNAFITLFLPLPFWGTSNIFLWFFSFENVILFYVFFRYILFNIKFIFYDKYAKFLFVFILSWLLIYVIISPGNLGTAMRYKMQILPIIFILVLYVRNFQNKFIGEG